MTDIDDFLAHQGVKGMRWGHRKAESSTSGTPAKRSSTLNKVGKGVAVGASAAGVAVGAYYAAKYGPEAVGSLKLVAHAVQFQAGQRFVNELVAGNSSLTPSKLAKGAYRVTSMR